MVLERQPAKFIAYITKTNSRQPFPGTYECTDVDWGHELVFVKRLSFTEPCVFGFNEVVLREYSGTKDATLKPAYDGDILEVEEYDNNQNAWLPRFRGEVRFYPEKGAWGIYRLDTQSVVVLDAFTMRHAKILGNIHEHSELLAKVSA